MIEDGAEGFGSNFNGQALGTSISPEDTDEMFELVFGFKRRASSFEPMEKCRRDIFEEHFGKIPD